jgi:hypothetical protein
MGTQMDHMGSMNLSCMFRILVQLHMVAEQVRMERNLECDKAHMEHCCMVGILMHKVVHKVLGKDRI